MTDGSHPRTTPPPPCRLFTADDLAGAKSKRKKKKAKHKQHADAAAAPNLHAEEQPRAAIEQTTTHAQPKTRRDTLHNVPVEAELEVRATNSAADMATRNKGQRDVLEGVQDMDVDFTAGASFAKGTAKKRPGERAHKPVAFKFPANDVKVPASRPPTSTGPTTALNLAQSVTTTVNVEQLEHEVRGVISDVRVLKDPVASLEHSQVKADVYMEMPLQAQGISLDQAKSRIEPAKQHLRLSQQQRGLLTPSAPPTTHESYHGVTTAPCRRTYRS